MEKKSVRLDLGGRQKLSALTALPVVGRMDFRETRKPEKEW